MSAVGGFVLDSSGAPVDREIRLYRRDTGELLGKTRSSGSSGGAGAATDADFDKVALLLHFDGANGSTAFTDNSPVPKTVTAYGSANISTTQSKWGGSSLAISGGSDYLSTPSSSSFDFAAQDFCVELYVRFSAASGTQVLVTNRSSTINDPGFYLRLNAGVIQGLCWGPTAGTPFGAIAGTTAITTAKWYHVAYCRSGGVFRLFVDGVLQGSVTSSDAIADSTYPLVVGKDPATGGREFFGHIDDLRITKGAARYTTNFTPPSTPFPDMSSAGRTLAFGEYYLVTTHTGEVQVVCMDDANEPLENDLILRTFPV